jgi:hypothetical protein
VPTHFSRRVARLLCASSIRVAMLVAAGIGLSFVAANVSAQSATRPYQMSIIGSAEGSDIVDIPIYHYNHTQPEGRSIVWLDSEQQEIDETNIDWRRIVAVYVDEPYNHQIADGSHTCNSSAWRGQWNKLREWAQEVRDKAPSARFWVNFRQTDIDLITSGCKLNAEYIDVISMDIYYVDFSTHLSARYGTLQEYRATPYQQFALVPGTFTGGKEPQSGTDAAARLSGYFSYASTMNQQCDLPLGPMGRTGIYDGCPVWMVAGWFGGTEPHGDDGNPPWYYPIDHANSTDVFNAWQANFALRRVDPARARQAIKAAPLLFNE